MCLLSLYPPGVMPVGGELLNGAEVNDDGGSGAVQTPRNTLIIVQSMTTRGCVESFLRDRAEYPAGWAVFHSRLSTGTAVNAENLHPFAVGGDPNVLLYHNGSIPALDNDPHGRPDSRVLAEDIMPELDWEDADLPLLERIIGPYGKAVIFRPEGDPVIINRGQWLLTPEGALHSNADYKGHGDGWAEETDARGHLLRWNRLQRGQCPRCLLFGCEYAVSVWEPGKPYAGRECKPAPTVLPRLRDETERMAKVAAA